MKHERNAGERFAEVQGRDGRDELPFLLFLPFGGGLELPEFDLIRVRHFLCHRGGGGDELEDAQLRNVLREKGVPRF